MSIEENKQKIRSIMEAFNSESVSEFDRLADEIY